MAATDREKFGLVEKLLAINRRDNKPSSLLRWREIGGGSLDRIRVHEGQITRRLQSLLLQDIRPWRQWGHASKDVLTAVWSPDGRNFAIGASADMDHSNIQYNERRNLLYGDIETNQLFELENHRIDRPRPEDVNGGDNSRQDMYNMMDPYLYATVTGICFDRDQNYMYTSSYDKTVKLWDTTPSKPSCLQSLQHDQHVQLLDISADATYLATGQDSRSSSIRLYQLSNGRADLCCELESERARQLKLTPTCLKFGPSKHSSHFLLAGFGEFRNELGHQDRQGELSLWDVRTNPSARLKLKAASRNVLDIVWHPKYVYFAAALATDIGNVQANRRGTKSYIRTWSPTDGPHRIYEFDCPALDVNELRFHPHRDNFISASCTDGATYLWDARRTEDPLIRLQHGEPIDELDQQLINVLGYNRAREESDTGVKLVTWGRDGKYLYTGSSDGIIKQWNPWVSVEDAHVRDLASYDSHVMTGAFSPDYSHLLVGTAKGSVHILSSAPLTGNLKHDGEHDEVSSDIEEMEFMPAERPGEDDEPNPAEELLATGQVVIHPYIGAGKGPMYNGPYAAWARMNSDSLDLASTELDADVLANQLHPSQWRRGLEMGGVPTRNVQERQEWLRQQMENQFLEQPERPKRGRDTVSSRSSPANETHMYKRSRPLDDVSTMAEAATPIASEDEPIPLTMSMISFRRPTLPDVARQSGRSSQSSNGSSKYAMEQPPAQGMTASMPIRTPSPMSVRLKESPKSAGRTQYTPGVASRPRASFKIPPAIRPLDDSPSKGAKHVSDGNTQSLLEIGGSRARRESRSEARQSAASAQERGELIILDDSD